jgi:hypothetical protein
MATYFQLWNLNLSNAENQKQRLSVLVNRPKFVESFKAGRLTRFADLLVLKPEGWDPDNFGPIGWGQYASVESLFLALMGDAAGQKLVKQCWDEVLAGRDPAGILKPAQIAKIEAARNRFVDETLTAEEKK